MMGRVGHGRAGLPSGATHSPAPSASSSPPRSGTRLTRPRTTPAADRPPVGRAPPLILIGATMTWWAGQTDAERRFPGHTFYVRVPSPRRKRPGRHFSGSSAAARRLPVVWAVRGTVRAPAYRTLAERGIVEGRLPMGGDGTRLECPRSRALEDDLGRASQPCRARLLRITALVSLRGDVLWAWRLGTAKASERQHWIDLWELHQVTPMSHLLYVPIPTHAASGATTRASTGR